jgi:hypothetical protein
MTPELKIAAKVPRHLPQLAKMKLLDIYNQLWIADSFANELKEALVVPILKLGKDPNLPTSYCFFKVMEKLVNNRLYYLLEKRDTFQINKTGFRKNRSTEDVLIILESSDMQEAFKEKEHLLHTCWRYNFFRTMSDW